MQMVFLISFKAYFPFCVCFLIIIFCSFFHINLLGLMQIKCSLSITGRTGQEIDNTSTNHGLYIVHLRCRSVTSIEQNELNEDCA